MATGKKAPLSSDFWAGEPRGEVTVVGFDAYICMPEGLHEGGDGILVLPNHRGWTNREVRLYTDKFASDGHLAVLPDLFKGDEPPLADMARGDFSSYREWETRHSEKEVLADVGKLLKELKERYKLRKFGVVGFCWGALHSAVLSGRPEVEAAVVIGPSKGVTKSIFESTIKPTLVYGTEKDEHLSEKGLEECRGVLKGLPNVPTQIKVARGTIHGWATDSTAHPALQEQQEEAFNSAKDWFLKYLR